MNGRHSTPETICLQCGDKGFTNAFVYCVKCLQFAVHRYCLDTMPKTIDGFTRWVCDDCDAEVQNQYVQAFECTNDANFGDEHTSGFEDDSLQNVKQASIAVPDGYRWIRYEMQQVSPTIIIYCREKCIDDIKIVLSGLGDTLNDFKKSSFGKLLNLPLYPFRNNQAMHYVLSREVSRFGGEATELWFYVNETLMRFSRFEFALLTGLRFGRSKFDPNAHHSLPSNSFYTRVLRNKPIKVIDLMDRFKSKSLGQDAADYLKVAKVIFAYCIVFSFDLSKTNVADWIWVLVEDSKTFDRFPWGSYSYQILLYYLGKIQKTPNWGKKQQYHLYGFSTAFLAWIYCAIPRLGEVYGGMLSFDRTPRILQFKFTRSNFEVENISREIHSTLEPTDEERAKSYWQSIEREGTPFELQFKRHQTNKSIKKEKAKLQIDHEESDDEEIMIPKDIRTEKSLGNHPLKSKVVKEEEVEHHNNYHFDDESRARARGESWRRHETINHGLSAPQRQALTDDMMSRLESRFNDLKQDMISYFEPRFHNLKHELTSQFDTQFNELIAKQNEMMSSFNNIIHRRDDNHRRTDIGDPIIELCQYWDIQDDEEQGARMSYQHMSASQGQQLGDDIGT